MSFRCADEVNWDFLTRRIEMEPYDDSLLYLSFIPFGGASDSILCGVFTTSRPFIRFIDFIIFLFIILNSISQVIYFIIFLFIM